MAEIKNWLILWTYSSEVQNVYLGAPLCRDVWLPQYQPDLMMKMMPTVPKYVPQGAWSFFSLFPLPPLQTSSTLWVEDFGWWVETECHTRTS